MKFYNIFLKLNYKFLIFIEHWQKCRKFYLIFNNKYTKINNNFYFLSYIKKKFIKYNYFFNIENINNYKNFEKKKMINFFKKIKFLIKSLYIRFEQNFKIIFHFGLFINIFIIFLIIEKKIF